MMQINETTQILLNARKKRLLTNCYSPEMLRNTVAMRQLGDETVLICEDHGIRRLYFFVTELKMLQPLLDITDSGTYYFEYMTNDNSYSFPDGKWKTEAIMLRMSNPDCRNVFQPSSAVLQYRDDTISETAVESDAAEINALLWSVFRTEISHLLTDSELADCIRQNKIFIHRTDGHIDAVLQTKVMPRKFYINQIVNLGQRHIIHAMLLKRLWDYVQNGGKYLYAWVDETNIASLKFHRKYGMKPDGYRNIVFRVEV